LYIILNPISQNVFYVSEYNQVHSADAEKLLTKTWSCAWPLCTISSAVFQLKDCSRSLADIQRSLL